jgi:hypothetical protein
MQDTPVNGVPELPMVRQLSAIDRSSADRA